jgi:hypothetical protein
MLISSSLATISEDRVALLIYNHLCPRLGLGISPRRKPIFHAARACMAEFKRDHAAVYEDHAPG